MKTMILCAVFSLAFYSASIAQKTKQPSSRVTKKAVVKKTTSNKSVTSGTTGTKKISINNSSAFASDTVQYKISDPVLLKNESACK